MGDCSVVGHDPGVVLESASALHPPRECEPAVTFTELRSGDRHGPLGSSIGWAILMSSIVLVANIWGVLTGERGADASLCASWVLGLSS